LQNLNIFADICMHILYNSIKKFITHMEVASISTPMPKRLIGGAS